MNTDYIEQAKARHAECRSILSTMSVEEKRLWDAGLLTSAAWHDAENKVKLAAKALREARAELRKAQRAYAATSKQFEQTETGKIWLTAVLRDHSTPAVAAA